MKGIFISLLLCICLNMSGQPHKLSYGSIALTNLHTDFPFGSFSSLVTKEYHPGFEIGTGFSWQAKEKHEWFQAFRFGYSYHRFVQHSISLYSEFGYRYRFLKSFSAESSLGAGYLHAIPDVDVFVLKPDGTYKKKTNLGHPQAMACLSVGVDKKITSGGTTIFLNYQQRLQFPFIKSYVPLLPSNLVMLGVTFKLKTK